MVTFIDFPLTLTLSPIGGEEKKLNSFYAYCFLEIANPLPTNC